MDRVFLRRSLGRTAAALALVLALPPALAQAVEVALASEGPTHSALDAPLFYQLLIGEIELRSGEAGAAYQVMLDAARRTKDDVLFRRAIEIALHSRAGEQALAAARAWRASKSDSLEPIRYEVQLLMALNRTGDAAEPLRAMLALTPVPERPQLIGSLPRMFLRAADHRQSAELLEQVLGPYAAAPETRTAARVSIGRGWAAAGESARALALAERAHADDPQAAGPALLALELLPKEAPAENLVRSYLGQAKAETPVRLGYVRLLTASQRYADAVVQLQQVTQQEPQLAPPWLSLGALWLELREPVKAEDALQRYLQLAQSNPASDAANDDEEDDEPAQGNSRGVVQAWLMLSQAAEQRGDYAAAESWLGRIDNPQRALDVQARRASLLAHQNKIAEARELIHRVPERNDDDARAKMLAEVQVLRDVKHWQEAHDVLAAANERFKDDADLIYEQAMAAEKLDHVDEMERLLKHVIELKPDHQHAYNALGYSLADRGLRLPEARELIKKALELAPGDPFITDSMGWVEYRMGNRAEALRLLRSAYGARPDTEIAAHLGEVLWVDGQHDEARRVLREAKSKDGGNELLRETIARLKVDL